MNDSSNDPAGSPTGPIALSLSGGGFRAAGFHLGVMTALYRAGLLDQVRVLSTASGGTLIGTRWMLGLARGESFTETHFRLSTYLESARPIPRAARRAAKDKITLTQALGEEFEDELFDDSRFTTAALREIYESKLQVEEGSFNATVGRSGQAFRFTFSRGNGAVVGHKEIQLPRRLAEHIRLCDVAAASAAFPGAFEPMVMPQDFTWPDEGLAQKASEAFDGRSHGLVDGGVHDNQGISAMLLAARRYETGSGEELGLYLVSDADRRLEGEEARVPRKAGGILPSLRVWHVSAISWLAILGSLASMFLTWKKVEAERALNDFRWPTDAIAYGVPLALALAMLIGVIYVRFVLAKLVAPLKPHLGKTAWRALKRLKVRDAIAALQTRARTLENVAVYAFPRRLRDLVYQSAWAKSSLLKKRVACQIYGLTDDRLDHVDGAYAPSETLLNAVREAAALPTGLHLESAGELESLQLTGQATAIARIIEYLEKKYGEIRGEWPDQAIALDKHLQAEWDELNTLGRALRPE